jgi:hypothetical protein
MIPDWLPPLAAASLAVAFLYDDLGRTAIFAAAKDMDHEPRLADHSA